MKRCAVEHLTFTR